MPNSLIDQFLSDFQNPSSDAAVRSGLSRGQDFASISKGHDQGILDDILPQGEHNTSRGVGIVAFDEDWSGQGAKPFTRADVGPLAEAGKIAGDDEGEEEGEEEGGEGVTASIADLKRTASDMLHLGKTPNQVAAHVRRVAEVAPDFTTGRNMENEVLKDITGPSYTGTGMAYIEPNHFMPKMGSAGCVKSFKYIKAHGQLRAASVKRIAACEGCENCKCTDGKAKCALYGLPIVGNAAELAPVVAKLTGGNPKVAALLRRHNGESAEIDTPGHNVVRTATAMDRPVTEKVATAARYQGESRLTTFNVQEMKEASGAVTPKAIQASLNSGKTLGVVYNETKAKLGSAQAQKIVKGFLDGLKKTGARINLAAVDCTLLKHRLTASETIIGKSACATCGLRQGMHCGRTGGTLLSYPGMETTNAKKASARVPAQDGVDFMNQIELQAQPMVVPINQDRKLPTVEMPNQATLNW